MRGHGLVYNVGERVEGYTNLLWTLLLAGALRLGIPPEISAPVLGIAAWLALVGILGWRSWRRDRPGSSSRSRRRSCCSSRTSRPGPPAASRPASSPSSSTAGLLLASRPRARPRHAGARRGASSSRRWPRGPTASSSRRWRWRARGSSTTPCTRASGWPSPPPSPSRSRWAAPPWPPSSSPTTAISSRPPSTRSPRSIPSTRRGSTTSTSSSRRTGSCCPSSSSWSPWAIARRARPRIRGLTRRHGVLLVAFVAFTAYVAHSGGDFMFARRLIPALPLLFVVIEDSAGRARGLARAGGRGRPRRGGPRAALPDLSHAHRAAPGHRGRARVLHAALGRAAARAGSGGRPRARRARRCGRCSRAACACSATTAACPTWRR